MDQAWHLHIVYTESYHEWCEALFGHYLHHGPTKGGKAEGARFEDQYLHTLALYERTFGEAPSGDIWPCAKDRFDRHDAGLWIQPARYWVIPRIIAKRFVIGTLATSMLLLLGLSISTGHPPLFRDTHAQSSERSVDNSYGESVDFSTGEAALILFFGGIVAVGLVVAIVGAARGKRGGNDGGGGGCSSWFGCGGGSSCGSGCGGGCGGCGG